jgi:hypothetical protein
VLLAARDRQLDATPVALGDHAGCAHAANFETRVPAEAGGAHLDVDGDAPPSHLEVMSSGVARSQRKPWHASRRYRSR